MQMSWTKSYDSKGRNGTCPDVEWTPRNVGGWVNLRSWKTGIFVGQQSVESTLRLSFRNAERHRAVHQGITYKWNETKNFTRNVGERDLF